MKTLTKIYIHHYILCFNPCFSGRGVKTLVLNRTPARWDGFNPCFSGRGVKTLCRRAAVTRHSSFNPCFSGRGVKTRYADDGDSSCFLFQSLFFWKRRENCCLDRRWGSGQFVFQSLFFWKRRENYILHRFHS